MPRTRAPRWAATRPSEWRRRRRSVRRWGAASRFSSMARGRRWCSSTAGWVAPASGSRSSRSGRRGTSSSRLTRIATAPAPAWPGAEASTTTPIRYMPSRWALGCASAWSASPGAARPPCAWPLPPPSWLSRSRSSSPRRTDCCARGTPTPTPRSVACVTGGAHTFAQDGGARLSRNSSTSTTGLARSPGGRPGVARRSSPPSKAGETYGMCSSTTACSHLTCSPR